MTNREHLTKEEAQAFAERIARLEAEVAEATTRAEAAEQELRNAAAELQEAGAGYQRLCAGSEKHVALWEAINEVVTASGGSSSCTTLARMEAVAAVEAALRDIIVWLLPTAGVRRAHGPRPQLFRVSRGDLQSFVISADWAGALEVWRKMARCRLGDPEPKSVRMVASADELLVDDDLDQVVR